MITQTATAQTEPAKDVVLARIEDLVRRERAAVPPLSQIPHTPETASELYRGWSGL